MTIHFDEKALHEAADTLNRLLKQAEDRIIAQNLGTEARVPLDPNSPGGTQLVFCKHNQKWGLFDGVNDVITPITSTSRLTRVRAAAALPRLYMALQEASLRDLKEVNAAQAQVARFIATFDTEKP